MTQELELTAALSSILQDSEWHSFVFSPESMSRCKSLFIPEALGYVSMQQTCQTSDLDKWHNHIRVQGYQDALTDEFNWDRDLDAEVDNPETLWGILHQVEDRIYETG
jgi:hypothetical protein